MRFLQNLTTISEINLFIAYFKGFVNKPFYIHHFSAIKLKGKQTIGGQTMPKETTENNPRICLEYMEEGKYIYGKPQNTKQALEIIKDNPVFLCLDDEPRETAAYYITLLEEYKNHYILVYRYVDEFMELVNSNHNLKIKAFILDLTLSPGETYKNSKVDALGLDTGIFVLNDLRKKGYKQKVAFLSYIKQTRPHIKKLKKRKNVKSHSTDKLFPFQWLEKIKPFFEEKQPN